MKQQPEHQPPSLGHVGDSHGTAVGGGNQLLLAGAAVGAVALLWSYWPTLADMVTQWDRHADYSHGYLVAPIAAFFLWMRRDTFPADQIRPSLWGLVFLAAVIGLRIAAGAFYLTPLDGWTFPLAVAGLVWLMFGPACLLWAAPSIAFLWFMVPLPYMAETWLSGPLQSIATKASTVVLVMLGQPAISEGHTIWIGEQQLFVEEACSGLRILIGIFALAFAFVLFSRWSWWQKALVVIAAVPIALTANMIRIVATGLLHEWVSGEAAQKFSHDVSGFVMIPLAAVMFLAFLFYLEWLFPEVEDVSPLSPLMRVR